MHDGGCGLVQGQRAMALLLLVFFQFIVLHMR